MTNQFEELEVKVAFLEDALTKLGDEFYLQQKELHKLRAQVSGLVEKLDSRDGDDSPAEILDERPPHY